MRVVKGGMNAAKERRQRISREQQLQQIRQDITLFRDRMLGLADNLAEMVQGRGIDITLREMAPIESAGAYTIPCIALCCGRNWAGFTPQALYSVKDGIQLKGEVCLVVDKPGRRPRTVKYMLCMPEHLMSAADWAIHLDERASGKWKVLTRDLLLAAIAPLFKDIAEPALRPRLFQ
ncbi:hypothetical protein [Enterobacter ludwigii]|uniref:hypothetical protein n=1 Tax=Enterobacter ludwigii TaxID=299767 RepID=UPI003976F5CD